MSTFSDALVMGVGLSSVGDASTDSALVKRSRDSNFTLRTTELSGSETGNVKSPGKIDDASPSPRTCESRSTAFLFQMRAVSGELLTVIRLEFCS